MIKKDDYIDFWVVQTYQPPYLFKLHGLMKAPGKASLEYKVEKTLNGCKVTQIARFDPSSHWGQAYWYALTPFHYFVFRGMLNGIGKAALKK